MYARVKIHTNGTKYVCACAWRHGFPEYDWSSMLVCANPYTPSFGRIHDLSSVDGTGVIALMVATSTVAES